MPITCLIVDDEALSRKTLEKLCENFEDLDVKGVCTNGVEAVNFLQKQSVDLLLLDIHMPDLSGIELVRSLDKLPQIVFTTTDQGFALEAFDYNVTDYLMKPVTYPRLLKAINRVKEKISAAASGETESKDSQENIFIKVDNRLVKLTFDEILWVEALGDYIQFQTEGKKYTVHMTMKKAESRLPSHLFQKVHRKYIVNISKIVDIEDNSVVITDQVIPISRANRETLMNKLNLL